MHWSPFQTGTVRVTAAVDVPGGGLLAWPQDADAREAVVLAVVVVSVILASVAAAAGGKAEAAAGGAVVALALLWLVLAASLVANDELSASTRLVLSAVVAGLLLTSAAREWSRRWLRLAGVLVAAALALLLADVGRDAATGRQATTALRELADVEASLQGLATLVPERTRALDRALRADVAAVRSASALAGVRGTAAAGEAAALADTLPGATASQREESLQRFQDALPTLVVDDDDAARLRTAVLAAARTSESRDAATGTPVDEAMSAACAAARDAAAAELTDGVEACGRAGATTGEPLDVQMALVRLRAAEHRQALLVRAGSADAVPAAEEALAAARAREPAVVQEVPFLRAVRDGADSTFDGWSGRGARPIAVDWALWLALGVLALLGWRRLERLSSQQVAGPVTLHVKTCGDRGAPAAVQEAVFRVAVLQNIAEPGGTPGESRASPALDLAELATASTAWVKPLLGVAKTVLNSPVGYSASVDVAPTDAAGAPWTALTRIRDEATGEQVAVKGLPAKDSVTACRAAGYWTAATLISRSTRVPSWSRWTGDTAPALAASESPSGRDVDSLEKAVAQAPSSGVLLHLLAQEYDLRGRHADALAMYARTVAAHPEYDAALYRMAVSATLLSWGTDELWDRLAKSRRQWIAGEVRRACQQVRLLPPHEDPLGEQSRTYFEELSSALYSTSQRRQSWPNYLRRLLKRSERPALLSTGPSGARALSVFLSARRIVRAAQLVHPDAIRALQGGPDRGRYARRLRRLERQARHHRSWWQLSYNVACVHARVGDPARALDWLEAALARPGSGSLAGDWLAEDPDLKSLAGQPRFTLLRAALDRSEPSR